VGKLKGQRLLGDLVVDGRVRWKKTGFKVSAAVLLSIQVVWDVTPLVGLVFPDVSQERGAIETWRTFQRHSRRGSSVNKS
jgi:hypothetical protein